MNLPSLQSQDVPLGLFLVHLLIALVLSWLLAKIYVRFGRSLSEKRSLAANFVPITMTTAMIISILQTNIVLSLGLVGALSIIRFRTAIKEPEELTYVFLCVALGLGVGAGQAAMTVLGFVLIAGILAARGIQPESEASRHLLLTVSGSSSSDPDQILEAVKGCCAMVELKRLEEAEGSLELALIIELNSPQGLGQMRAHLLDLDSTLGWTVVDHRHLI